LAMFDGLLACRENRCVVRGLTRPGFAAALILGVFIGNASGSVGAAVPVEGTYTETTVCTSGCVGTFVNQMVITSYAASTGAFSGTLAGSGVVHAIAGSVTNGRFSYHLENTAGNPGYRSRGSGTVAADGSWSGKGTDYDPNRAGLKTGAFTFSAIKAGGGASELRIGTVVVSLSERLQRRAEQLRGRFVSDSTRKEAIEAALPAQRNDVERAQARVKTLEGQIAAATARIDATRRFISAYADTLASLPSDVQSDLKARASLEGTLIGLEDQLSQAEQAGDTATATRVKQSLGRARNQLAETDRSLRGRDGTIDKQGNDYIARLRSLQNQLFALRHQLSAAIRERAAAQDAENGAHAEESAIDADLLELNAEIVSLDFDLKTVSVTANGQQVFAADITGPFLDLQQVDSELAALEPQLTGVENVRKTLSAAFITDEKRSIDALGQVTTVIKSNALIKAGIDGIDFAYEVSKGFGQGGPIGALGAAVKKGLEGLPGVLETINSKGGASELDEKFDTEYLAGVKKTLKVPILEKASEIGWTRLFKDTVNKPLKDWANAGLLKLYEKLYRDVPSFYAEAGPVPPVGTSAPAAVKKLIQELKAFQEWAPTRSKALANLRKGGSFPTWDKLKYGLVKDLAKAAGKAALDLREQAAWEAYFEAEAEARGVFELWQKAWTEQLKAEEQKTELELKKQTILEGFSPAEKSRSMLDKSFPSDANLVVTLTIARPAGATGPIAFDTLIGGKAATAGQPYTYSISASGLPERRNGLGLEVRAH
jgi:hypothetical protein